MNDLRNLAACGLVLGAVIVPGWAAANTVSPPQGYIYFDQIAAPGAPGDVTDIDFNLTIDTLGPRQNGTFWSNTFFFADAGNLPEMPVNYQGGSAGGYVGLQRLTNGEEIAIFSLFWGTGLRSDNPDARFVDSIEMWYLDDNPFEPPITSLGDVDTSRPTAGGPFVSIRTPIDLQEGSSYALSLREETDLDGTWWSAVLTDTTLGIEQEIGDLGVAAAWGGIATQNIGGFVEHFGPMPEGCDSIPQSTATFGAATSSTAEFSIEGRVGGACEIPVDSRTDLVCTGPECRVEILQARAGKVPVPLPVPLPLPIMLLSGGIGALLLLRRR